MNNTNKKEVTPQEFMAWAMIEKLVIPPSARLLMDDTVAALYELKKITKAEYDKYLALTKAAIREV